MCGIPYSNKEEEAVARSTRAVQEEAVRAINENLYVDDYLHSTETTEQAITKGRQAKEILANGDLHLRKWTSNVPEVASALRE